MNWWEDAPVVTDEKTDAQWWDEAPAIEDSPAPDMTPAEAGERMGKAWDTATDEELPVSMVNENFDEFERISNWESTMEKELNLKPHQQTIDFDELPFSMNRIAENVKDFHAANKDYFDARREIETQNTDIVKTFLMNETLDVRIAPPERPQIEDAPQGEFTEPNLDALSDYFDQQKTSRLPGEFDPLEHFENPFGEFNEVEVTGQQKLASVSSLDFEFIAQTIQNNPTQFDAETVKMVDRERTVRALIEGLRKAPEGDQIKAMTAVQFANIFNFNEFTSRYGINLPEKILGIVKGEDVDGLYSAALEASARFMAEKNQADPMNVARIAGVGADVAKAIVEFGVIGYAMGPAAFANAPAAIRPFLASGTKFAIREALQSPREGETAIDRLGSTVVSGAYGATMAGAGKFIPAAVRVPLMPIALGGMTYAQTGDVEQALETGATILGFQAIGLWQKGMKFTSQRVRNMYADKAIQAVRKHNPEMRKLTNQEVARYLDAKGKEFEKAGAKLESLFMKNETRQEAIKAWNAREKGNVARWDSFLTKHGLKPTTEVVGGKPKPQAKTDTAKPESPSQQRGLALPAVQTQAQPIPTTPQVPNAPQATVESVAANTEFSSPPPETPGLATLPTAAPVEGGKQPRYETDNLPQPLADGSRNRRREILQARIGRGESAPVKLLEEFKGEPWADQILSSGLDATGKTGDTIRMAQDEASRDIAPQDNAGGKRERWVDLSENRRRFIEKTMEQKAIAGKNISEKLQKRLDQITPKEIELFENRFGQVEADAEYTPDERIIAASKAANLTPEQRIDRGLSEVINPYDDNQTIQDVRVSDILDVAESEINRILDVPMPTGRSAKSEARYWEGVGNIDVRLASHDVAYTHSDKGLFIGVGKGIQDADVVLTEDMTVAQIKESVQKALSFNPPATGQGGLSSSSSKTVAGKPAAEGGATTGEAEYGTKNRVVPKSEYEEILNRQKKAASEQRKPGGKRKGTAYTPGSQDFKDLVKLGMYHLEAGSRNFGEWSKRMVKELGTGVKPSLDAVYAQALTDFEGQSKERGFIASVRALNPELKVEGQYIPKSNDVLSMKARNLVRDNLAEAERIARAPKDDNGVAVLTEVIKHYNSKADAATDEGERNLYLDRSAEVANEAARFLTEAGRTVQAASLLSRLTPEGQLRFAAREIQKYNEQIEKNRGGIGGLRKKIPELTGEQADYIRKEMEAINKMPDGEDRLIRLHKLNRFVSDLVPTPFFDKLNAVWRAGLLTGIKTSGLNVFSNQAHLLTEAASEAIATPIDMAIGLLTGERSRSFTMQGTGKGAAVGTYRGLRYLQTGFDSRDVGAKLDYRQINWGQHPMWKTAGVYADTVYRLVGTEDQPFYYATYMRSLGEQAKVQAINQGYRGEDAQKLIDHLVNNPTEQMLDRANRDARTVVFQQESGFAKLASSFQKAELAGINLGRWVLPFGKTPANVAVQIVNYTPVGGVAAIIDNIGKGRFNQRDFTKAMGRSILGTGAMVIGTALFRAGMVALDWPTTEQEREQWRLEGKKPNSIKVDGKWRSAHVLGPVGNVLLMGAHFQRAYDETGSISEAAEKGLFGSAKSFTEQTFLTGMSRVLDAITDPERSAGGLMGQQVASFIPTLISDIARSTDPLERRADTVVEKVMARVPGLRQGLEPQVSALGQERERAGTFWETMLDPTRPTKEIDDPVVNELRRLMDAGYPATPTLLGGRKGYDVLTKEENTELQKRAGTLIYTMINRVISSEGYNNSDDIKANEVKSDLINDSIRLMRFIAKYEMYIQKTQGLSGVDLLAKIKELQEGKFATRDIVDASPEEIDELINSYNIQ